MLGMSFDRKDCHWSSMPVLQRHRGAVVSLKHVAKYLREWTYNPPLADDVDEFERGVRKQVAAAIAEGERRGREAEQDRCVQVCSAVADRRGVPLIAEAVLNVAIKEMRAHSSGPSSPLLARGAVRQTFEDGVIEGSKLGAEAVAKVITETTERLSALQWFHDEVSAMLAQKPGLVGMAHLRPILELRADPRYEPIRAARKEGA